MVLTLIIPHHNSSTLLERLLKTVPDSEEIQVIVVDDKSKEEIVLEVEKICSQRKFTEVIYITDSKGAGKARNIGLSKAKGDWLLFADADDYFSSEAFSIFEEYTGSTADIIYFGHIGAYSDTLKETDNFEQRNSYISAYLQNPSINTENKLRYSSFVPWGKIIKRELVVSNNISFDETRAANDQMFSALTGGVARTIAVDSRKVYTYTLSKGTLTKKQSKEVNWDRYTVWVRFNQFLLSKGLGNMQVRLISSVFFAFKRYGLHEGMHYISFAREHNVPIVSNLWSLIKEVPKRIQKKKNNNI